METAMRSAWNTAGSMAAPPVPAAGPTSCPGSSIPRLKRPLCITRSAGRFRKTISWMPRIPTGPCSGMIQQGTWCPRPTRKGKTTYYDYDALSRLVSVTDPNTGETRYAYDDRDNLTSLTDAEGNVTRFAYNRNNQLIRETRPLLQKTAYSYDGAGNLVEKIDAKNQKTTYWYDDMGKLVEIKYFAASTDTAPAKTVAFTYDAIGNLTGYDDGTTSGT
ncbi:MAG: RHS repeat protein, partial [Desulfobacterium sp.]|nr:RHS repeat protein [Desulfobacterium sp.]